MKHIDENIVHKILDNLPQVVWTADADGTVDYYNKGWEDLTGIGAAEGLGTGWAVALHPDDEQRTWDAWNHSVKTGEFYEIEHRLKSGSGYKWVLSRGRAVKDNEGNIIKWYGTAVDISKAKTAEAELEIARSTYRLVGESIDYGVWRTNAEGRLTYISKSFLELLGITQPDPSSVDWSKYITASARSAIHRKFENSTAGNTTFEEEHHVTAASGEEKVILSRGRAIIDSTGKISGWVGINLDITELKKKEAQLSKSLNEKEILLFELNHRVKNNLQLISSLINLQINVNEEENVKKELRDTKMRLDAISLLYDKLSETRSINELNLQTYIKQLVDILRVLNKNIKFDAEIDSIVCSTRFAVNIGLLLNEIITNSYKYAFNDIEGGSIQLKMKISKKNILQIKVGDNGVGLPGNFEELKKDSFGSQIIQSLISQENGTVKITSGGGTLYEIEIPLPHDCSPKII